MALSEYDFMAHYYDYLLEPVLAGMRKKIVEISRISSGTQVLEVACGTGAQAKRFKEAGADYQGVDISLAMLEIAGKQKLGCIHADGTRLPLADESFDMTTVSLALHEVDPEIRTLIIQEMIRVTKKGGSLVIADYTLPIQRTRISFPADGIIHLIEKIAGGNHYRNYRLFMKAGGLTAFLKPFDLETDADYRMFGGNLGIIRLNKV